MGESADVAKNVTSKQALGFAYRALDEKEVSREAKAQTFTQAIFEHGLSKMKDREDDPENNSGTERTQLVIEALKMAYDPTNETHVGRNPRYIANELLIAACNEDFGVKEDQKSSRKTTDFEGPPVEYAQLLSQLRNDILPPQEAELSPSIIEHALVTTILLEKRYFAALKKRETHKQVDDLGESELETLQDKIQSSISTIVKILEWTSADINKIYVFIKWAFQSYGEDPDEATARTEWLCMELVHGMLNHKAEKDKAFATIEQTRGGAKKAMLKTLGLT